MSRSIGDFRYKKDKETGEIVHNDRTVMIATPDIHAFHCQPLKYSTCAFINGIYVNYSIFF